MTQRSLIALAIAGALAVPAFGQQSNSAAPQTSSTAVTSQSTSTVQPAADQQPSSSDTATQKAPLQYERHEGFWGKINPFARKKYVQRQLNPVRDRLNELDQLTASNSKMIKDVDSRASEGIRVASLKANEADQHALDAGNRAQLANQAADQANNRLQNVQRVVTNIDQFQPASQVEIRFRPGQRVLSKKAKDALDEMASPLKSQKGYIVEVQGFSSGRGESAIQNSQLMADSVVRYLVLNSEIPVYRIYKVGMGNAPLPSTENGAAAKRVHGGRVEISLLKNGIGDLTTEPATPAATTSGGGSANSAPLPQSDQTPAAGSSVGATTTVNNSGVSSSKPAQQPVTSQPTTPAQNPPPPQQQ